MQHIYFFLFSLILATSCSSQIAEKNPPSETLANDITLRVDSILQFTVMVTDILEDSKGNFWFGSHGDGLCRYDGKEYTYFTANQGLPNGVMREFAPGPDWSIVRKINSSNQISQIREDKLGNIWIMIGSDMVCKFDGQKFNAIEPVEQTSLSNDAVNTKWATELDYLWFSPWGKSGVYRYDGNKLTHLLFPHPYSVVQGVSEIYKDNEGTIWFGTMNYGTFRYNGTSFIPITKHDEIGICRSIFQDNTGKIWISNNGYGLYYLKDGQLTNFIKEYASTHKDFDIEEFQSGFQSIEQDKNGDLWFGTFGNGLWRYDGEELTHYTPDDGSLPFVTAKTIYKDKSGQLWFGLGEGSVYGFNGESFYRLDGQKYF